MIRLRRHSRNESQAPERLQGKTAPGHHNVPEPVKLEANKHSVPRRIRRAGSEQEFGRQRRLGSAQQSYVSAEAVIGDVLVLAAQSATRRHAASREYRAILEVGSVNYTLKTEGEQEAILAGYRAFLNGLTFPLQILVQVRPLDLAPYIVQLRAARERLDARDGGDGKNNHQEETHARSSVWARLAEDEARYVLELAAQKTLLERRFYIVISCDGEAAPESSVTSGSGLLLAKSPLPLLDVLPLPGRARRRRSATLRSLGQAAKALDLRVHAIVRELERLGLETRRLTGTELVSVYHRAVSPESAARHPLPEEILAGVGRPPAAPQPRHHPLSSASPAAENGPRSDAPDDSSKAVKHAQGGTQQGARAPSVRKGAQGTWSDLADLLAPASVSLTRDTVRLDDTLCRTLAVVGYPRHVYAGWLERLIDLDEPLDLVLHLHPQPTATMIRQLSHRLVQLHSSRLLNEERSWIGHAELGVAYTDVEQMREKLQRGDERIFATSLYVHVRAPVALRGPVRQLLDERVARVDQELANQQLVARPATFEQDLGLLSCLPEGRDRLMRTRLLDTSSLATAFPFLSNSLSMPDGILFGTTANGSPVFIDAFSPLLENANQVIFAKSGAGKSYGCKVQTLRSLLRDVDVYVVDPEAEYEPLAAAVDGQTVRLAAGAEQHLNPFDLPMLAHQRADGPTDMPAGEDGTGESSTEVARDAGDILADKVQSLHALLDLMLADRGPTGTVGLSQREKGLLDRALYEVYRRAGISSDPSTHSRSAPLLRDLYDVLVSGECGADETHLADRLHRYARGSLSRLFAAPTNVGLNNRLVVFDVRDMDAELRPLGLFLIADFVWTRIRRERRPRLLVIDEAWTLMQYQEGGRFLASLARRARKYFLGLITITQDAEDFLSSEHGRTVLANSSVQLLMKQDSSTIEAVTRAFRLSTGERQYLLGCHKGEGLLFARGGHVALQIEASPFEHELATTDPRELAARHANRAPSAQPTIAPATQAQRPDIVMHAGTRIQTEHSRDQHAGEEGTRL